MKHRQTCFKCLAFGYTSCIGENLTVDTACAPLELFDLGGVTNIPPSESRSVWNHRAKFKYRGHPPPCLRSLEPVDISGATLDGEQRNSVIVFL